MMLKYFHSCMFGNKTLHLVQAHEIYTRKGFATTVLKKDTDTRDKYADDGWGIISSRFNHQKYVGCHYFHNIKDDLVKFANKTDVFLIDEAQFLSKEEVKMLKDMSDNGSKIVIAYGLKTDVNGNTFEGSQALIDCADEVTEIPMLCQDGQCLEKATHHARYVDGVRDTDTNPVKIEKGNVTYRSLCIKHWRER